MKDKIISLVIILIFALIFFFNQRQRDSELNSQGIYSIATITGFSQGDGMGTLCEYTFKYKNKDINKDNFLDCYQDIKIGDRFFVLFSKNHKQILFDKPVPDSILVAPIEGWSTIPVIDSTKIPIKNCMK